MMMMMIMMIMMMKQHLQGMSEEVNMQYTNITTNHSIVTDEKILYRL